MRLNALVILLVATVGIIPLAARASDGADASDGAHVGGTLRGFGYFRYFTAPDTTNPSITALSAVIDGETARWNGFRLGASIAGASTLGTISSNPDKVMTLLMGMKNNRTTWTQAYAEYGSGPFVVRLGDQYLNTPWVNDNTPLMIPASYEAAMVSWQPSQHWNVQGFRVFEWRSDTSDRYFHDNMYYPVDYRGNTNYSSFGLLPGDARQANGTWALGGTFTAGAWTASAWYYDFLGFARLAYASGSYTFSTGTGIDPFVKVQYATESTGSDNILIENRVEQFGVVGSRVKSRASGFDAGVNFSRGSFDVAYNNIAHHAGAFGGGAVVAPYQGYTPSDPLYTSGMTSGLIERGPGHAWKATAAFQFFNGHLTVQPSYTYFQTSLVPSAHNVHLDIDYVFTSGPLKGLTLRNRWERDSDGPNGGSIVNERILAIFKF